MLIVLVSVLLSVSVSYWLGSSRARESRAAPTSHLDPGPYQALELRLAKLEARVDEFSLPLSAPEEPAETLPVPARRVALANDAETGGALAARMAALERRLATLEPVSDEAQALQEELEQEERERQREQEILDAQATLADPRATVAEKVEAHGTLRRVADAYTSFMVADLVRIGANDPVAAVRANVWRYFDGSSHLPELVPHLLHALAHDLEAPVRDEAAETLGNYADDPAVLAALRYAAEHDESPKVRQKAARTLRELESFVTDR